MQYSEVEFDEFLYLDTNENFGRRVNSWVIFLLCCTKLRSVRHTKKALSHVRKSAGALLRSDSAATTASRRETPRAMPSTGGLRLHSRSPERVGTPTRRYQSCFLTYIRVWVLCVIGSERRLRKSAREYADAAKPCSPIQFPGDGSDCETRRYAILRRYIVGNSRCVHRKQGFTHLHRVAIAS